MTTTRTASAAPAATTAPRPAPPTALPASGRRRPALVVIGALLAIVAAFATIRAVVGAGQRVEVLAVARDVPAYAVLSADDLRPVFVAVDAGVATIDAAERSSVIGTMAAVDLTVGELLAPSQLTESVPPGPDEVLVGLPVAADQLPAGGLVAGDQLRVVEVPSEAGAASGEAIAPRAIPVEVVRLGPADVNGVAVLDVVAADGDGDLLAVLGASGRFALVLLHEGGAQR